MIDTSDFFLIFLVFGTALLWTQWRVWGRWMLAIIAGFFVIIVVLPIGTWLVEPLEGRIPEPSEISKHAAGIIFLPGVSDHGLDYESEKGIHKATELVKMYRNKIIAYCDKYDRLGRFPLQSAVQEMLFWTRVIAGFLFPAL